MQHYILAMKLDILEQKGGSGFTALSNSRPSTSPLRYPLVVRTLNDTREV